MSPSKNHEDKRDQETNEWVLNTEKTSKLESENMKSGKTSKTDTENMKTEEISKTGSKKDEITRMFILGPSANISSTELVRLLHMMELPLTIKTTCYGAAISGDEESVMKAVRDIRKADPYNIFTKDRGFPPGDPRRCRAKRGGAREGFHQLEKEFELLDDVSKALKNPHKVEIKKIKKVPVDEFRKIAENSK